MMTLTNRTCRSVLAKPAMPWESGAMTDLSDEQLREAARALGRKGAASRAIVEGHCAICGTPIRGTRKRTYCSNTCAARAYRQRQRAAASQSIRRRTATDSADAFEAMRPVEQPPA